MKFYELSKIGAFHVNHNEDALLIENAGKSRKLIAVMDGCSSGTDSHFASTLISKVLRKIAKQESYREYLEKTEEDLTKLLENISLQLFTELGNLNRQLDLKADEILSTLILGIIEETGSKAEFIIVGDGMIHYDGKNIEYENDNRPDYIGYHLNMNKHLWFDTKIEKLKIERFKDLSISTDGIHTFKNHDGEKYPEISESDIMYEFFESKSDLSPNKLKKTLIKMEKEYGLEPSDDLTLIRVINIPTNSA